MTALLTEEQMRSKPGSTFIKIKTIATAKEAIVLGKHKLIIVCTMLDSQLMALCQ